MLFNDTWSLSVRTFGVMYNHTFLNLQITKSDIIKWAVSLVIAYGNFNLGGGGCCVGIYGLRYTHLEWIGKVSL